MKSFFFTFGGGSPFAFEYIEIQSETLEEARNVMFSLFGPIWSMCYDAEKFAGQVEAYGLHCLAVIAQNEFGTWRSRNKGETS